MLRVHAGLSRSATSLLALAACTAVVPALHAQSSSQAVAPPSVVALLELPAPLVTSLPDAPGAQPSAPETSSSAAVDFSLPADAAFFGGKPAGSMASVHATVIQPGQTAPRLTISQKMTDSFISSVTPTAVAGWVISAGYSQATNGSPNYGQTGKGFAQRLGAAAARSTSETVFGNGVIASITHEDPRYYRMGPGHGFFKRVVYAATRPLLTRTDGGHSTINLWDLGGDLAGSALTPVYYPPLNTSGTEVLKTFGGSVGGDALGFLASEFLPGILSSLHMGHGN